MLSRFNRQSKVLQPMITKLKQARFQQSLEETQPHPIPAISLNKPVITVQGRKAVCDGLNTHPKIYMNLDQGEAVCGYCGNIYKQDNKHHH